MNWKSFEEFLYSVFSFGALPAETILSRMFLSLLLGLAIGFITLITYRGIFYQRSFFYSQVILTVASALIILVIGDNVARAFGLMGALNLIRFSSRIKDPKDSVMLFYSVGIGMASGSGLIVLAVAAILIAAVVLTLFRLWNIPRTVTSRMEFEYKGKETRQYIESMLCAEKVYYKLVSASSKTLVYKVSMASPQAADLAFRIQDKSEEAVKNYLVDCD